MSVMTRPSAQKFDLKIKRLNWRSFVGSFELELYTANSSHLYILDNAAARVMFQLAWSLAESDVTLLAMSPESTEAAREFSSEAYHKFLKTGCKPKRELIEVNNVQDLLGKKPLDLKNLNELRVFKIEAFRNGERFSEEVNVYFLGKSDPHLENYVASQLIANSAETICIIAPGVESKILDSILPVIRDNEGYQAWLHSSGGYFRTIPSMLEHVYGIS